MQIDNVNFETFNNTLRSNVNGFYVHAKNDPSITQEEALQDTMQMAENYLNATDEFQANAAAEQAANMGQVEAVEEISNVEDTVDMTDPSIDTGSIEGGSDMDDGIE